MPEAGVLSCLLELTFLATAKGVYGDEVRFGYPPISYLKWVGNFRFLVFSNSYCLCVISWFVRAPASLPSVYQGVLQRFHI